MALVLVMLLRLLLVVLLLDDEFVLLTGHLRRWRHRAGLQLLEIVRGNDGQMVTIWIVVVVRVVGKEDFICQVMLSLFTLVRVPGEDLK